MPWYMISIKWKQSKTCGTYYFNVSLMLIAMRLPFCSPFHVFLTSGHMLRELAWCGFRSWCKYEWTAVVQMASLRVWMPHPQTTAWRWQGLPTAPLWGTPYTFHPNIWPEESCFNENLFKLQNYNTNISQYLKGLSKCKHWGVSIYLEVQVFRHLRSEFLAMPAGYSTEALVYWPLARLS